MDRGAPPCRRAGEDNPSVSEEITAENGAAQLPHPHVWGRAAPTEATHVPLELFPLSLAPPVRPLPRGRAESRAPHPARKPDGSGAQGYAPGKSRCCGKAERDKLFWEGLEIEANKTIRLQDEELASLRSTKRLLQIFQNQVPKTPEGIKEQLEYLSQADTPLSLAEFDQLLFTSVYCAYQIRSIQGLDKNLWISFFSQLVDEIIHDLCKGFCPANSTLLASWPWKEKPFYLTSLKKMYHSNPAMMKRGTV